MGAQLIFKNRFIVATREGRMISIYMDLFRLPPHHDASYPEGYKFSWIAFDVEHPEQRVLFDCHSPKGPHMHIDADPEGTPFAWSSLAEARKLFCARVEQRFGEIPDFEDVER